MMLMPEDTVVDCIPSMILVDHKWMQSGVGMNRVMILREEYYSQSYTWTLKHFVIDWDQVHEDQEMMMTMIQMNQMMKTHHRI